MKRFKAGDYFFGYQTQDNRMGFILILSVDERTETCQLLLNDGCLRRSTFLFLNLYCIKFNYDK